MRRRVSSWPSPRVTRRRNICRAIFWPRFVKAAIDFFSAFRQGAKRTADVLIRGNREQSAFAAFEQFRQGVLQQRQRARLFTNIFNDAFDQPLFKDRADAIRGTADGLRQFFVIQRQDQFGTGADQFAEALVEQRPIHKSRRAAWR